MNMLKFGYGIVLDGIPDIPEFHFFLGSGRPKTRFSSNVVSIFQKILEYLERRMSGSQACRGSPHGPIEKEMCQKKSNHSGCLLSQILFHCFVCLCICIFFFFLLSLFVLYIMYVPIL